MIYTDSGISLTYSHGRFGTISISSHHCNSALQLPNTFKILSHSVLYLKEVVFFPVAKNIFTGIQTMSVPRIAPVVFYFYTAHFITKHLLAHIYSPYIN